MPNSWDVPINKLNQQISELHKSLEANQELENDHLQGLELARQRLKFLMQGSETKALAELPKLLQTIFSQQTVGVIILGEDSKILLFNSTADRIFGLSLADVSTKGVQTGTQLFLQDKTTLYADGAMPWERAMRGEDISQENLYLKRPDLTNGMNISVNCTTLNNGKGDLCGAVALVLDLTEHVQIEHQLKVLCNDFESQLHNIETARQELKTLTEKIEKKLGSNNAVQNNAQVLSPLQRPPQAAKPTKKQVKISNKILVVDDIPVNQKLLIMHLKKMGFEVESAINGKEAVAMVETNDYCVVFMDCDMPVMNGFEATIAIRQSELASGKHIPIVAMTSYDRVGDRERCLSIGMDEYLTKGVAQKQLQETVQWCLSRLQTAQEAAAADAEFSDENEEDEGIDIPSLINTFGKYELEEIFKLFLMSSTTLTSCLQFAIEDHDLDSISHFAYSLKGPCSSIGLNQLARVAADITTLSEQGQWEQAAKVYKRLRRLFDQIRSQIEAASNEHNWVLI